MLDLLYQGEKCDPKKQDSPTLVKNKGDMKSTILNQLSSKLSPCRPPPCPTRLAHVLPPTLGRSTMGSAGRVVGGREGMQKNYALTKPSRREK